MQCWHFVWLSSGGCRQLGPLQSCFVIICLPDWPPQPGRTPGWDCLPHLLLFSAPGSAGQMTLNASC